MIRHISLAHAQLEVAVNSDPSRVRWLDRRGTFHLYGRQFNRLNQSFSGRAGSLQCGPSGVAPFPGQHRDRVRGTRAIPVRVRRMTQCGPSRDEFTIQHINVPGAGRCAGPVAGSLNCWKPLWRREHPEQRGRAHHHRYHAGAGPPARTWGRRDCDLEGTRETGINHELRDRLIWCDTTATPKDSDPSARSPHTRFNRLNYKGRASLDGAG
jgi:hypothetical protein